MGGAASRPGVAIRGLTGARGSRSRDLHAVAQDGTSWGCAEPGTQFAHVLQFCRPGASCIPLFGVQVSTQRGHAAISQGGVGRGYVRKTKWDRELLAEDDTHPWTRTR